MTLSVNKKILFAAVIVLLAVAVLGIGAVKAQPSTVITQAIATATTTRVYMTPGTATTTYQFDSPLFSSGKVANMGTIDSGSLYTQLTASTSATRLSWQFQCSNNNIDWYNSDEASTTPGSATASTTNVVVRIASCVTLHERVIYTIPVGTDGGALYAEVDLKKNPSNP